MTKKDNEYCYELYNQLNVALMRGNIDSLAEHISPDVYNEYKEKEIYLKNNKYKYIYNSNAYKITYKKIYAIEVAYILDKNNEVVEGDKIHKHITIKINYVKKEKTQDIVITSIKKEA